MSDETRLLAVTKHEAELIMDSFKVSNPLTRAIALKAAGIVLEFAAAPEQHQARVLLAEQAPATYDYGTERAE